VAGGIVATNRNSGIVRYCINSGAVSSTATNSTNTDVRAHSGGIVAFSMGNSSIIQCGNTGTVTADGRYFNSFAGGIVASAIQTTITDVYNRGMIRASINTTNYYNYAGGIAGILRTTSITNSFNTGTVYCKTNDAGRCGGIIGYAWDGGSLTNNYWLYQASGNASSGIGDKDGTYTNPTQYSTLSSFYILATTLGSAWKNQTNAPPIFTWE
jgi:hypothetical protein